MAKSSRLTIGLIEGTRPGPKDIWLSDDDGSRGAGRLALRVSPSGSRLFYFRYFIDGKRTVVPLGPHAKTPTAGFLTLEEAREVTVRYSFNLRTAPTADMRGALLARLQPPASPVGNLQSAITPTPSEAPPGARKGTVLELCNAYVEHLRKRGAQSASNAANIAKNHVQASPWAEIPAAELTAEQATDMIRRVVEAGHMTTASHLRQLLQAAYNMAKTGSRNAMAPAAFKEFCISTNPITDTASLKRAMVARERPALSKLELGHMWLDLIDSRHDLSVVVRAIRLTFLLGGQRCLQLLRCKLSDLNLEKGVLVLKDGKGRRTTPRVHTLPLTIEARTEALALRQMALDLGNSYLIPGKVEGAPLTSGPITHLVSKLSSRLVAAKKLGEPFCYANIRSTIETNMAELEIALDIRGEIQSHGLGGVQKKHYDHWNYLPQKLKALEIWAKYLHEASGMAKAENAKSAKSTAK